MKISPELQSELRAKFNPDGSLLRAYQEYLVDILCNFDRICKKIGVEYWLSQGTVLGAVRHGGFIPWDDDIDVEMRYSDFVKFCKNFKESERFALQDIHTDPFYPLPFAKFRDKRSILLDKDDLVSNNYKFKGAFIDIFYTEYRNEWVSKIINLFYVAAAKSAQIVSNKIIKKFLIYLFTRLGLRMASFARFLTKIFKCKNMGLGYGSHFYDVVCNESDLFPLSYMEFEDYKFPVPSNCDEYLRTIYGEYMIVPNCNQIKYHITDWKKVN